MTRRPRRAVRVTGPAELAYARWRLGPSSTNTRIYSRLPKGPEGDAEEARLETLRETQSGWNPWMYTIYKTGRRDERQRLYFAGLQLRQEALIATELVKEECDGVEV